MQDRFLESLYRFFREEHIPYALLSHTEGMIDLVMERLHIHSLIAYIHKSTYKITSFEQEQGRLGLFCFASVDVQWQLNIHHQFQQEGIVYLDIDAVLQNRVALEASFVVSPVHGYIYFLIQRIFCPQLLPVGEEERQKDLFEQYKEEIEPLLRRLFGSVHRLSRRRFFWTQRHQMSRCVRHYTKEFLTYVQQPHVQIVAFLGPDGAGKSTVLERLWNKEIAFSKTRSHTHLKPQYWLKKRSQSRGVVSDPHAEEPRDFWTVSLKMLVYVQEYWIDYVMRPHKEAHLKIFDRYMHDILLDKRRYRIPEDHILLPYLVRLAPQPTFFVVLNADPEVIQSRKQEVSFEGTQKQCASYLSFAKKHPKTTIIVNANQDIDDVLTEVITKLSTQLHRSVYKQLMSIFTHAQS